MTFALGEAFQFDWSEEGLLIGGIYRRMQLAHLKLCTSRAFWLVAYPSQGHEVLFDAHTRSFSALGGVPRRGIYDNMKTAVDKFNKGKGRTVNARFAVMCAHYLAGLSEICYAAAIARTQGFTRLWPSLYCGFFIVLSLYLLAQAVAYAVWVGIDALNVGTTCLIKSPSDFFLSAWDRL